MHKPAFKLPSYRLLSLALVLFLVGLFSASVYASPLPTAQFPDRMIYKGDTVDLFSNPLEDWLDENKLSPQELWGSENVNINTACWRGYVAWFELLDGELFLSQIQTCEWSPQKFMPQKQFKKVFGKRVVNGKVKVDWFSSKIVIPEGELLDYVHMGYMSTYERERILAFEKGSLVSEKVFDNLPYGQPDYYEPKELKKKLDSLIRWELLPDINAKTKTVMVQFATDSLGYIKDLELRVMLHPAYDLEALRVVRELKKWITLYRNGHPFYQRFNIVVDFNREKQE